MGYVINIRFNKTVYRKDWILAHSWRFDLSENKIAHLMRQLMSLTEEFIYKWTGLTETEEQAAVT